MIQYLPVILLCSLNTPVEQCNELKLQSSDIIRAEPTNSPISCYISGNALVASTGISPQDGKYYIKVKCVPKET